LWNGSTKDFLFPDGVDLGILIELKRDTATHHVLNEVAGGLHGRERRKLGIDSSDEAPGLHLLLGFVFAAIEQKYWISDD
jgi:hypothetical protein